MVIRGLSREKWFQSTGIFDFEVLAGVVFLGSLGGAGGWFGGDFLYGCHSLIGGGLKGRGLTDETDPCCCCGVEPDAIGLAWKPVAVSGGYSGGAEPWGVGFVFTGVVFDWLRV
jgi:hypothetical protein